jgi:hypothetical protein
MKYQEINPSNSRISVIYPTKDNKLDKPNVGFSYVNKKPAIYTLLHVFLSIWMKVIMLVLLIIIINIILFICIDRDLFFIEDFSLIKFLYSFFLLIAVPPIFLAIAFHNNENILKMLPKINKILATKNSFYYKKITKINKKSFEIPLFENVFLNYEATGDFSRYLKEFKIIEHDFDYCEKKMIIGKIVKEKNQYLWKALFKFHKIPKKGELKIYFY